MTTTATGAGRTTTITPALLTTLALLSAVAPFAIDLYLPAFPTMVDDLHTTPTGVQLTLTAFLFGLATGQLVFGPLSDRFGRVAPLVTGAVICVAASVAAVLSPTVEILIAARFVQGCAGAAGMVIGRAIIADLATGRAAARAFSLMMIVGGIAPVVAPLAGGFLVGPLGGSLADRLKRGTLDAAEVARLADHLVLLHEGRMVASGPLGAALRASAPSAPGARIRRTPSAGSARYWASTPSLAVVSRTKPCRCPARLTRRSRVRADGAMALAVTP